MLCPKSLLSFLSIFFYLFLILLDSTRMLFVILFLLSVLCFLFFLIENVVVHRKILCLVKITPISPPPPPLIPRIHKIKLPKATDDIEHSSKINNSLTYSSYSHFFDVWKIKEELWGIYSNNLSLKYIISKILYCLKKTPFLLSCSLKNWQLNIP